jgi:hypothetical protein
MSTKTIKVLIIEPGNEPYAAEIPSGLESLQKQVGGLIQVLYPFPCDEPAAILCNDEGKLMQMKPSRAIFDEDGRVMDVIAGPFFICYAPIESETFLSLPDDLKEEMRKKFDMPERYYRSDEGLMVLKYDPKELDKEQAR